MIKFRFLKALMGLSLVGISASSLISLTSCNEEEKTSIYEFGSSKFATKYDLDFYVKDQKIEFILTLEEIQPTLKKIDFEHFRIFCDTNGLIKEDKAFNKYFIDHETKTAKIHLFGKIITSSANTFEVYPKYKQPEDKDWKKFDDRKITIHTAKYEPFVIMDDHNISFNQGDSFYLWLQKNEQDQEKLDLSAITNFKYYFRDENKIINWDEEKDGFKLTKEENKIKVTILDDQFSLIILFISYLNNYKEIILDNSPADYTQRNVLIGIFSSIGIGSILGITIYQTILWRKRINKI